MVSPIGPKGARYPKIPGFTPRFRLGSDVPYTYRADDPDVADRETPNYKTWKGEWEVEP